MWQVCLIGHVTVKHPSFPRCQSRGQGRIPGREGYGQIYEFNRRCGHPLHVLDEATQEACDAACMVGGLEAVEQLIWSKMGML